MFDPIKVAKLELDWWQAHHVGDVDRLHASLTSQVQELYQLNSDESEQFVVNFMDMVKLHDARKVDEARESMWKGYQIVLEKTSLDFDPQVVGDLEIDWIALHDELEFQPDKSALREIFMQLYAELFSIDEDLLLSEYRVLATYEHDLAEKDGIDEATQKFHWERCGIFLRRFYFRLRDLISP